MGDFLITLKATRLGMLTEGPTEQEMAIVRAHFQYLVKLHGEGRLTFAGRTQDDGPDTVGLAVIRAASEHEAQEILSNDPAIVGNVFVGQLQPYVFAVGGEKMWPAS